MHDSDPEAGNKLHAQFYSEDFNLLINEMNTCVENEKSFLEWLLCDQFYYIRTNFLQN